MNAMQRAAAIGRLQEMAEWLPDGCFGKTAVNAAVGGYDAADPRGCKVWRRCLALLPVWGSSAA